MAKSKNGLTDDQILAICQSEIESAAGYQSSELSNERSAAMDYYLGELYGDEQEGRSSVVTREVLETVEWCMPSLIRIFTDQENCVVFDPVGPEDAQQAKDETACVNHVFWKQNRGFYNLSTVIKDALLSKTGILKIWWDDSADTEREEYSGINDQQLGALMNEPGVVREMLEYELDEDNTHRITFMTTWSKGKVKIDVVPPEEFGISREARSPYVEDANFAYHRTKKTFSELVDMGYDASVIRTLPTNDDVDTQERLARRYLTDEEESLDWADDESMRNYWITEAYVRLDRNGDDRAELLQVVMAAGAYSGSSARLLSVEEVDRMPFATATPILRTHTFYGISMADLTLDLQRIKSALLRQQLDSIYLSNNSRIAVNDRLVNLDDLLTSRPGGVVRFKSDQPASNHIMPIPHTPLPPESFGMMEYLDEVRKQRTGVGDEVAGLDKNALASVSPTVAAIAFDAARMKIELIARNIAEMCLAPAFSIIHELMTKKHDHQLMLQLNGTWMAQNPGEWKTRHNTSVRVGTGTASRERRLMALEAVMQKQMEAAQAGGMGTIVMPHHLYQARADYVEASGLHSELYFQDPRMLPPPPPPQPDAQQDALMMSAQAQMLEAQVKQQRNQLDMQKAQMEMQLKMREQELKQQEQSLRSDLEQMRAHMTQLKNDSDTDTKIASLELQMDKQSTDQEIKRLEVELKHIASERDRQVELYRTQIDALTKVMQSHGVNADPETEEIKRLEQAAQNQTVHQTAEWVAQLVASNQALGEAIGALTQKVSSPKIIKRDAQGLVIAIGDQSVTRDKSGRVTQVG